MPELRRSVSDLPTPAAGEVIGGNKRILAEPNSVLTTKADGSLLVPVSVGSEPPKNLVKLLLSLIADETELPPGAVIPVAVATPDPATLLARLKLALKGELLLTRMANT